MTFPPDESQAGDQAGPTSGLAPLPAGGGSGALARSAPSFPSSLPCCASWWARRAPHGRYEPRAVLDGQAWTPRPRGGGVTGPGPGVPSRVRRDPLSQACRPMGRRRPPSHTLPERGEGGGVGRPPDTSEEGRGTATGRGRAAGLVCVPTASVARPAAGAPSADATAVCAGWSVGQNPVVGCRWRWGGSCPHSWKGVAVEGWGRAAQPTRTVECLRSALARKRGTVP